MTDKIDRKATIDPGYEQRIREAISSYFGRRPKKRRSGCPPDHEQGRTDTKLPPFNETLF